MSKTNSHQQQKKQLMGISKRMWVGLVPGRNVNRIGVHSNSSLGGSLSRLILSTIKVLVWEGMSRMGGDRKSSIKVGRR